MPDPQRHDSELTRIRRRTLWVLATGQVLGGISFGATVSLGAIIVSDVSGDESLSGLASAFVTLGAAVFAIPLARLAKASGRRPALAAGLLVALVGVCVVIVGTGATSLPLLLTGVFLIGAGQAANLQSRFAAADLATDRSRARDISLVVWATTIGAVLGPNVIGPGEALGDMVGMPSPTGPYLFTIVAQALAVVMYLVLLRPDPLRLADRLIAERPVGVSRLARSDRPAAARYAIVSIAGAHGVMVALMAMTPIHLMHGGATLTVIGLTISLHIAGMYALSPLFGFLADRIGRVTTVLIGQALFAASLVIAAFGQASAPAVTVSLVLLGLGWSASTVAGAALLTEATAEQLRTRRQGRSDLVMNLTGAGGAVLAGVVLGWIGYGGLALVALTIVVVVTVLSPLGRAGGGESRD
ncbi:MFS transporter [Microbacterium sp. SORGH_AS_0888]|uniref:MFS transporter n=1 Tax=Microbacterium sp. SORGH_AS_0888 TaxID=3041791 RepID=UPI0027816671|nr:MFS transporter [Microbacterium sp. SORGH_AS_0888]MDQ1128323.1 MFS family permease [Microbacterium sp. SORGH_AS_0888]